MVEMAFSCSAMYGHDPDHGDDRDQAAEQRALAVARGHEVGERGDAVRLQIRMILRSTSHHTATMTVGPEVDRQEADAGRRGPADAAVVGPGRRVDADRQRVDVAVADDAAAPVGAPVAVVGDGEQQPEVGRGRATMTQVSIISVPRDPGHQRDDQRPGARTGTPTSSGTPATTASMSNTASSG